MDKAQMEIRFGKGPEHEELSEIFADFAFVLDQRLPDGAHKNEMLSHLDHASVAAHKAVKDAFLPVTNINNYGEGVNFDEVEMNVKNFAVEPPVTTIKNYPEGTIKQTILDDIKNAKPAR